MVSKATWQVTKKFLVVLFTQVIWKQGSFPNANAHSDSVSCSLLVLDRTWSMQCSTNPCPCQQAIISHFQLSCLDWCSLKTLVGSRKENPNVLKGKNIGKKSVLHSMPGHHLFLKASIAQYNSTQQRTLSSCSRMCHSQQPLPKLPELINRHKLSVKLWISETAWEWTRAQQGGSSKRSAKILKLCCNSLRVSSATVPAQLQLTATALHVPFLLCWGSSWNWG